ncbi:hypothetical protein [Dryocola sp. BD586]|jgi:hypothetical protein|uniref:hypothetical protein n=1 Tax=Dryocola sp. BD586 TaxID=3133271 RepID=UPI003F4F485A
MSQLDSNEQRRKEGEVNKGLPETAPHSANAYEEDEHKVKEEPRKQGEVPRTRDDSDHDKKDPYKEK